MSTATSPRQLPLASATATATATSRPSSPELSSPPRTTSDSESARSPPTTHDAPPIPNLPLVHQSTLEQKFGPAAPVSATLVPAKRKYTRKKDGTGSNGTEPKATKLKTTSAKPRAPYGSMKKKKEEEAAALLVMKQEQGLQPSLVGSESPRPPLISPRPAESTSTSQTGNSEDIQMANTTYPNQPIHPPPPTQPARTSGQNYDPIRSVNMTSTANSTPPHRSISAQISPNRASASPSISSLIDPPTQHSSAPIQPRLPSSSGPIDLTSSNASSPVVLPAAPAVAVSETVQIASKLSDDEIDRKATPDSASRTNGIKKAAGATNGVSSSAQSPKPFRQKETLPPLPSGNGLLSSALFGGPTSTSFGQDQDIRPPTVVLHIPMKGETNKVINFQEMALAAYGQKRLYPRIAAAQERKRRIDQATAALEKGSASGSPDEMSLDASDGEGDGEGDSNVEMGGTGAPSEAGDGKTTRKRRPKADQYDVGDDFIDDSETAWEAQAAASKDGFFVYSGPLIPAGEKPAIERYVFFGIVMSNC